MGIPAVSGVDIQTDAAVFRMIDQTLFPADNHPVNGNAEDDLEKSPAILRVQHDGAEQEIILNCQLCQSLSLAHESSVSAEEYCL